MEKKYKKIFVVFISGASLAMLIYFAGGLFSKEEYVGFESVGATVLTSLKNMDVIIPSYVDQPENVKAIYMTSWVAGTDKLRRDLIDFVSKSNINSVVLDIKDTSGKVAFDIDNKYLRKIDPFDDRIKEISVVIDELHHKNIYVIGRISVFQDDFATEAWPNKVIREIDGNIWLDKNGNSWMDPASYEIWEYNTILAKEAFELGFDEINFDYVRFPEEWGIEEVVYPVSKERFQQKDTKDTILEDFLVYTSQEIDSNKNISVSFAKEDMDGLMTIAGKYIDTLSPVVYPSSFEKGYLGYDNPSLYPYEVIYETMQAVTEKVDKEKLRPWLQDFNLGSRYTEVEIMDQQSALNDVGVSSWMMWDPSNRYTKNAYFK